MYRTNYYYFLKMYEGRIKDQYVQNWRSNCENNRKLQGYIGYKRIYDVESYVLCITIDKYRKTIANFRSSSHPLMIEKGRHYNLCIEDRICLYCESEIEDEYHFVLKCPMYSNLRRRYIQCT